MTYQAAAFHALKVGLVDCVHTQLAATDAGSVDRRCVVPGSEIAWDDCECGQLTVHQRGPTYPSKQFPLPHQAPPFTKCDAPWWVAEVVVTVLRCSPSGGPGPQPPSCTALAAAARTADDDAAAMLAGVECCLAGHHYRVTGLVPTVDDGMCVGQELTVLVGVPHCPPECP